MNPRFTVTAAGTALGGYAALQWLGRTYGATRSERRQPLAGDELCATPQATTTHAITIDAPAGAVWPWLVQMGWGRGQWYTARWVDRLLFPANGPSADRIVPELQHLEIGDRILDGAPEAECSFVVEQLEANRHLVLHSREPFRRDGPNASALRSTGPGRSYSMTSPMVGPASSSAAGCGWPPGGSLPSTSP